MTEGAIFVGDGCDGTDTLLTDEVSDTTLIAGAGWIATTVDCGFNSDGNVGGGGGGGSGVSTACGAGMERLRIVAIC